MFRRNRVTSQINFMKSAEDTTILGWFENMALCSLLLLKLLGFAFTFFHGVVVRASASQSVDLGFIPLVESYQKDFKNRHPQLPCLALGI